MKKNVLFSALALVFLWLVWLIAYFAVQNDYVIPSFGETLSCALDYLADGGFWTAFGNTFARTLVAFVLSLALGTGLAALTVQVGWLRAFFAPVISVLRTLPTMAIVLMLLLWTTPSVAPVIVCLLVLFPAVYSAALSALDDVKQNYGELAAVYRVSAGRKLFRMYLPLVAPDLLRQSGGIFSMGLKVTVSGEVLSLTYRSLGGLMQDAKMNLQTPRLFALTLVTVLLGFALEGLCYLVYKLAVRWRA